MRLRVASLASSNIVRAALLACGLLVAAPSGTDRYDHERVALARAQAAMSELGDATALQSPERKRCSRSSVIAARKRVPACPPLVAPPARTLPANEADGEKEPSTERSQAKPASSLCTRKPNSMRKRCSVRYLA